MKSRYSLLAATAATLLPVCASLAQEPAAPKPEEPKTAAKPEEPKSPLAKDMDEMGRNFRKLKRQFADPAQKDSSVALVDAMLKNVETAKTLTPSQIEKVPQGDKAKYTDTFQKRLDELSAEYTALKGDIADGKADEAKAEMAKIGEMRDKTHKELGVEMEKH